MQSALIRTFRRRGWFFYKGAITSIAFSPDGTQALSGSQCHQGSDQRVRIWDVTTGEELKSLKSHRGGVRSVAYSPDGKFAVSSGGGILKGHTWIYDAAVRLWDISAQKEIARFGEDMFLTWAVAYTPDGRFVLTGSHDEDSRACLRLWDVKTQKEVNRIGDHPCGVDSLCVSPCGRHVLTGSFGRVEIPGQAIKIFDIEKGTEIPAINYRGRVSHTAYTPNGLFAITGGAATILWDLQTGNEVRRFKSPMPLVGDLAITPDGKRLLTANGSQFESGAPREDCTVRIFDISSGNELCVLSGHKGMVTSVACSPDGRHALSGDEFGEIRYWNIAPENI